MFLGEEVSVFMRNKKHLLTVEVSAVILLIRHYVENGELPTDDERLRRIADAGPKNWAKIKPVIAPFFDEADWTPRDRRFVRFLRWDKRRAEREFRRMKPEGSS
jgi:uncharacterized protein YdaU (DUF1376 family)